MIFTVKYYYSIYIWNLTYFGILFTEFLQK